MSSDASGSEKKEHDNFSPEDSSKCSEGGDIGAEKVSSSEDVVDSHECGKCGAQFHDPELFLNHKTEGCSAEVSIKDTPPKSVIKNPSFKTRSYIKENFAKMNYDILVLCPLCQRYCRYSIIGQHGIDCIKKFVQSIQCPVCKEEYHVTDIDGHISQCRKQELSMLNCLTCDKQLSTQDIAQHMTECKTESDEIKFLCCVCNENLEVPLLKLHLDYCRLRNKLRTKLTCVLCSRQFKTDAISDHIIKCCQDNMKSIKVICPNCEDQFLIEEFDDHMPCQPKQSCPWCKNKYPDNKFMYHFKKCDKREIECTNCDRYIPYLEHKTHLQDCLRSGNASNVVEDKKKKDEKRPGEKTNQDILKDRRDESKPSISKEKIGVKRPHCVSPNRKESKKRKDDTSTTESATNERSVKVPDENLTPQQGQHRVEQLAMIRKIRLLFSEQQHMDHNQMAMLSQQQNMNTVSSGMLQHGAQQRYGPDGEMCVHSRMEGCFSPHQQCINDHEHSHPPSDMFAQGMMGSNFPNASVVQLEWQKLQHHFFEEWRKKQGPCGSVPFSHPPIVTSAQPSMQQASTPTPSQSTPQQLLQHPPQPQTPLQQQSINSPSPNMGLSPGTRMQGSPPPYHQTRRGMPSPHPASPNTSSLSLPSTHMVSGLSSPADPSREFPHPTSTGSRLPHPSPGPITPAGSSSLYTTPLNSPKPLSSDFTSSSYVVSSSNNMQGVASSCNTEATRHVPYELQNRCVIVTEINETLINKTVTVSAVQEHESDKRAPTTNSLSLFLSEEYVSKVRYDEWQSSKSVSNIPCYRQILENSTESQPKEETDYNVS